MLSILTFNVGLLIINILGIKLEPVPYIEERLKYIAIALNRLSPDIISLQEIYREKDKQYLISSLKDNYPYYSYYTHSPIIGLNNSFMLFSKEPIIETKFYRFNDNYSIDEKYFDNKGILVSSIKSKEFGMLDIYNTHTTAGGLFSHPESKRVDLIRALQIKQLLNLIKVSSYHYSIITGDINAGMGVSEDNYNLIIKNDFIDTFNYKNPNDIANTWDPKNILNSNGPHKTSPAQRIDHIFIHKTSKFHTVSAEIIFKNPIVPIVNNKMLTISDHYGLLIKIIKK